MALPTSYLTSVKNLEGILTAIRAAQAPEKFTIAFLESLDFKTTSDRLVIGVFKSLGFLDDGGRPTERYFRYLDQTQSEKVMAEAIREAYDDLFRINISAYQLAKQDVINKFKTLSQGKLSESVLDKLAMTFTALVKHADFSQAPAQFLPADTTKTEEPARNASHKMDGHAQLRKGVNLGGLVYNIQIVLPESRDPAVYDALFQSLRRHLL